MPAVDFVALVQQLVSTPGTALRRHLLGDSAAWGPHEENTARLLDLTEHEVQTSWTDRITDPDDPEVKRERAEAKRRGQKPPPSPLILPVALRPEKVAEQRFTEYVEAAAKLAPTRVKESVSTSEFDAALGLEVEYVSRGEHGRRPDRL